MRWIARTAAVIALTAASSSALAAPALADDSPSPDYSKVGARVAGPGGACNDVSAKNAHVTVCFGDYGDKLFVRDNAKDGRSAYGEFDDAATSFRGGDTKACRNPYGIGTWAVCDYAIVEGTRTRFQGYTRDNEGLINVVHDRTSFVRDLNNH